MNDGKKSKRSVTMSQTIKLIRNAHPGMVKTQVFSMPLTQLCPTNQNGAFTGLIGAKMFGRGLSMASPRSREM